MLTFLRGTIALFCVALTLEAGNAFAKDHPIAAPAPDDPAAASYHWPQFTKDYQVQMDGGYDAKGHLNDDPKLSYLGGYMIAQADDRCTQDIAEGLKGPEGVAFRMALKTGLLEMAGTVIGFIIGDPGAGRAIFREIAGESGGAGFGGGLASGDEEVKELLGVAHFECVYLRVAKNRATFVGDEQPLWNVIIVPAPRFNLRWPTTGRPDEPSPADQPPAAPSSQSGSTTPAAAPGAPPIVIP